MSEELFVRNVKNNKNWATVSCAVYFHNANQGKIKSFLSDSFQLGSYSSLLGRDSLNPGTLNSILTKFWLNRQSYYFDEALYNSIKRYLKPPIHQKEEGIEVTYTKEQQELIRSEVRPRRKIKGAAGSGKTFVLAKRAVNAHIRTGGQVLILTYNLSLKNYIRDRINDVREEFCWSNFYITNYHQFFKTQANNCNLKITSLGDWQNTDFFKRAEASTQKFDVVLIDEVQDYQQEWIDIVTKYFIHQETEFLVFGDEKQNIYNRVLDENKEPIVRTIPGTWNKTLNTSHRFSSNIGNIAIKFQKTIFNQKYNVDEISFLSQLDFERRIIECHIFKSYSAERIVKTVFQVVKRNEIHSSDVGILCSKVDLLGAIEIITYPKVG